MEQGTTTHDGKTPDTEFPLGFPEFIMLIATMMALNALSIDPMLPALPAMGKALGIIGENERQWIISSYFLGLGIGSLFYGSLSDRRSEEHTSELQSLMRISYAVVCLK